MEISARKGCKVVATGRHKEEVCERSINFSLCCFLYLFMLSLHACIIYYGNKYIKTNWVTRKQRWVIWSDIVLNWLLSIPPPGHTPSSLSLSPVWYVCQPKHGVGPNLEGNTCRMMPSVVKTDLNLDTFSLLSLALRILWLWFCSWILLKP